MHEELPLCRNGGRHMQGIECTFMFLAEQRICVPWSWLREAGSLPAEDAQWVPTGRCYAAPQPSWWCHPTVWCSVYLLKLGRVGRAGILRCKSHHHPFLYLVAALLFLFRLLVIPNLGVALPLNPHLARYSVLLRGSRMPLTMDDLISYKLSFRDWLSG